MDRRSWSTTAIIACSVTPSLCITSRMSGSRSRLFKPSSSFNPTHTVTSDVVYDQSRHRSIAARCANGDALFHRRRGCSGHILRMSRREPRSLTVLFGGYACVAAGPAVAASAGAAVPSNSSGLHWRQPSRTLASKIPRRDPTVDHWLPRCGRRTRGCVPRAYRQQTSWAESPLAVNWSVLAQQSDVTSSFNSPVPSARRRYSMRTASRPGRVPRCCCRRSLLHAGLSEDGNLSLTSQRPRRPRIPGSNATAIRAEDDLARAASAFDALSLAVFIILSA